MLVPVVEGVDVAVVVSFEEVEVVVVELVVVELVVVALVVDDPLEGVVEGSVGAVTDGAG
jgi:hypothetical protein